MTLPCAVQNSTKKVLSVCVLMKIYPPNSAQKKTGFLISVLVQAGRSTPTFDTQLYWLQLYLQEGLTHGAGVFMDLPIQALNGVILSGAGEPTISYLGTVFAT